LPTCANNNREAQPLTSLLFATTPPPTHPLPTCATDNRSFLPLEKRSRTSLLFTTHELNALNARLRDAAHDCLVLTEKASPRSVLCCLGVGYTQCALRDST